MASQSDSVAPEVILARLTGEGTPHGSNQITPISLAKQAKSNFHALVIGINQYLHHTQLQGAVNDASLFKSYLINDLLVPEEQITTLFDAQATRAGIIQAFQNLATDPMIHKNDPIVIYYAGHGAEIQPPPSRRATNGSRVQCLVPQDAGTRDLETAAVPPIPDFTISGLLNRIANAKGDNISVIFDSCHSASVTRTGLSHGSRSIPWLFFSPLPEGIDSELLDENSSMSNRSLRTTQGGSDIQGMQSHILLAACSSKGLAYENLDTLPHHGYFTTALLNVLRSVGPTRLSYKSCIQRLPKIKAARPQDPVCEGINVNRMLFNAVVSGADNSYILLGEKVGGTYLQAGAVHGITPGCLFAIHADLIHGPTNPQLGAMIVDQVTPFESLLKKTGDTADFIIPKPAYGRQIGAGDEHVLDLYITPEFEKMAQPDSRWKIAFSGGEKDVILRLVEKDLAELIVDANVTGRATFTFPRLMPAIKHGVETLKRTTPTDFQDVYKVVSAAARFVWHLERFPELRRFQSGVRMEFYKLKESGRLEETGGAILEIDGGDLNDGGAASILVNNKDQYGFRIVNSTSRDLYAYLFYFSVTTLAISSKFLPVIGNGQVDPSLPKGADLTLGYGSGDVKPFQFSLRPGEATDIGVFKLFLSTSPIDLSSMEQPVPFRIEPRRLITENEAKHQFESLQVGIWDAITMELKLAEPPRDVMISTEAAHGIQVEFAAPAKEEESISEVESLFPGLALEEKHTLLQDSIARGLIIDPKSGPRFSSRLVSTLLRSETESFSVQNTVTTEEVMSSKVLAAALIHIGFPPIDHMSKLPLLEDFLESNDRLRKWTTRRAIAAKLSFSVSPKDFLPNASFVSDIENALKHSKNWQRLKALKEVVEAWGVVIPLSGMIGRSSVATKLDRKPHWPRLPSNEELESETPSNWRLVKVTRVASILELLDNGLQDRVKELYAGLIFRSPCVGTHQLFGFDAMNRGRHIEEIEVGFSDLRIESILIRYDGEVEVGPYGCSQRSTQIDRFRVAKGEGITEIIVWATDCQISSLQLLESGGRASPIYGATQGLTQIPKLLGGDGCFLIGLAGGFDELGITQIQAIWRGDTHKNGYRRKQTSHIGGHEGVIWSDLDFMSKDSDSRISSITARTPGTGLLGGLQIIYTSLVGKNLISQETPVYGTAEGPTVTWEVGDKEQITRIRGRHDGKTICELQFVTNKFNYSPVFGQSSGDITFDIKAPKTSKGENMVLHFMVGKSEGCVNSIIFVWAEPAESLVLQFGGTIAIFESSLEHKLNPRATFYELCAKSRDGIDIITSYEEYSKANTITRLTGVKPPLHALIIGINNYETNHHLAAALQDALNFRQYLDEHLLVPVEQITLLLNEEAKRNRIIKAFQDLADEDNGIKRGDAIVIYYAGYGSEVDPPPDRLSNGSLVKCIIPQDISETNGVFPIPEFTIGALVHKIAMAKGNNITLIFDCCYSAAGFLGEIPSDVRSLDKKQLPSLPKHLDYLITQDVDNADPLPPGSAPPDTHVLLTACGYQEAAFENRTSLEKYGYFSMALLNLLRNVEPDSLTYKSLMQRLPALKTDQPQNPACEGRLANRILFDAQVKGTRASFIAVEPEKDGLYLQAGLAQGVTPGSSYAIHAGDMFGPSDTIVGTLEVDQVDPFVARLKNEAGLDLTPPCYGRQVGYGPDEALSIYFTEAFVGAAERSDEWSHVLCGGKGGILLRPTDPGLAQVVVSVYGEDETTFTLTNQASVKYRIKTLPLPGKPPVAPTAPHVVPILSALVKWNWYLCHAPTPRPFQKFVDMEFYKLQSLEEPTDEGNTVLSPVGENLVVSGEVNIVASAEDLYGIRVINRSSTDLYLYLFSLSPTSLAIEHKPICSSSQSTLLSKSQSLTIGYGPNSQKPFTFPLDFTQNMDAMIFRLFVSTHPTNIEGVEQESPFEGDGVLSSKGVRDLFDKEAVWDVLGVNVAYNRWSNMDETVLGPVGGGITMIPNSGLEIIPSQEPSTIPALGEDIWSDRMPLAIFPEPTADDTKLAPCPNGALFTGRSPGPRRVEALTSAVDFLLWFRTPTLTKELRSSIRCMRLRTFAYQKGPYGAIPNEEKGAYFEISVIGPNGFPKISANKTEMTYQSHSAPKSLEWTDGMIFEEDHEIWGDLEVGDYFEVSIRVKGKGWVCEAMAGNLIFW